MTLKLAGRNPAKFIFDDGVSETTVTIQPDDEPDSVRAKLQRVLELEGPMVPMAEIQGLLELREQPPVFTPADRQATEDRLKAASPLGWETADLDSLPEA